MNVLNQVILAVGSSAVCNTKKGVEQHLEEPKKNFFFGGKKNGGKNSEEE